MKRVLLLLGDTILLYISLACALFLRNKQLNIEIWDAHFWQFSFIFIFWLIIFFINGLYEINKAKNNFKFYGKLIQNLLVNGAFAVLFFYLISEQYSNIKPQTILLILLFLFSILFIIWRHLFYKLISSSKWRDNLAIIGVNTESFLLAEEIINKPQLGYKLKLIINPDYSFIPEKFHIAKISKDIINMKKDFIEQKINTVVTVDNPKYSPEISRYLFESINLKIKYFNLTDFYEKITGKVPVTVLKKNWFLENLTSKNNPWYIITKRIIDILFSIILSLISLIFLPIIFLAIKLESKGPLIYKQKRMGINGKIYTIYKLRSMIQNAEKGKAIWAKKNDTRITKVGKFIRNTRIDEIPQLWNILKGDMSFVGPRPERPKLIKKLKNEIPFYNERHLVKSGLTGWAQINFPYGSSIEDSKEKLQYDLFYIKNQSLALDISIILKTINIVFNKKLSR